MKTSRLQLAGSCVRRFPSLTCVWLLLCALWGGGATARAASATAPDFMTYQGFLVDATGTPLATNNPANYPVNFRIYSASTGGTLMWSELQVVTVDRGQFSVVLGEGTAIAGELPGGRPTLSQVFTNVGASELYLEIQPSINGTLNTILPRLRLVSSPYAYVAASANKLVAPNNGATYLTYNAGAGRVDVNGNFLVTGNFTGNGAGLTNLSIGNYAIPAGNITSGTLADARLSANVAMRNAGNAFSGGNQTVNGGNLGVGTASPNFPVSLGTSLGNTKLALWDASASSAYGLGIQSGQFRLHVNATTDRFSFLNGPAGTEVLSVFGDGRMGLNSSSLPTGTDFEIKGTSGTADLLMRPANSTNGFNFRTDTRALYISSFVANTYTDEMVVDSVGHRVGIGTAPSSDRLEVLGNVHVQGTVRADNVTVGGNNLATGGESLKILRGRFIIGPPHTIVGTANGWTVSGTTPGIIEINYSGFTEPPAFTASIITGGITLYGVVSSVTSTKATVVCRSRSTDVLVPGGEFSFIAVGPR